MNTQDPAFDGLTPWPKALEKDYHEAGIWGTSNLADWLEARLAACPNDLVLSGPGFPNNAWQQLTGVELLCLIQRLALGMQRLGLRRGDRVVMQLGNSNAFVVLLFALFELGVIPVMALPGHRRREIEHFIRLTNARAWFASEGDAGMDFRQLGNELRTVIPDLEHVFIDSENPGQHASLASLLVPQASSQHLPGRLADPAGIALLLCSGGTTGLPKLIPRTHRDYIYNATASAGVCELSATDRYMVTLPAAHNFPLACPGILGAINVGAAVVMCPAPSPEIAFDYIARAGVTCTALVPPLVTVWLDYAEQVAPPPESLRLLQVGGARLDARVARRIRGGLGCALQQVFGMAEGLLNFTRAGDPEILTQNTQGRPMSDFDELKIVDAQGGEVPAGKPGELWTRGPYTLRGYYRDDEANQRAFSSDGYYRSGDLVRQLSSGHLVVEGRIREVIRRGAETVAVEALEALLMKHTAIQNVAVIGLPSERLGEQVCAVLVLVDSSVSPKLADIRSFLSEQGVARFMLPDLLEFVNELPLTAVGKIARRQLLNHIQQNQQAAKTQGLSIL